MTVKCKFHSHGLKADFFLTSFLPLQCTAEQAVCGEVPATSPLAPKIGPLCLVSFFWPILLIFIVSSHWELWELDANCIYNPPAKNRFAVIHKVLGAGGKVWIWCILVTRVRDFFDFYLKNQKNRFFWFFLFKSWFFWFFCFFHQKKIWLFKKYNNILYCYHEKGGFKAFCLVLDYLNI